MAARFDDFTERARRVLTLAKEEAQHFNHDYIGTEHLLLGLVREGDGVAAKVLSNLGVELNKVRSAVEFIIGRGDRQSSGEIRLTPRAKKVIELAVDEARRLSHSYIGTEHLLLGLVREGDGDVAEVLESLGATLERVRAETKRILGHAAGEPSRLPPSSSTDFSPSADSERERFESAEREGAPTQIVRDAVLLQVAVDAIDNATEALDQWEGRGIEKDLVEELVLPKLRSAQSALHLSSDSIDELERARRTVWESHDTLTKVRGVFERAGEYAMAGIVGSAAFQLAAAVPLPG